MNCNLLLIVFFSPPTRPALAVLVVVISAARQPAHSFCTHGLLDILVVVDVGEAATKMLGADECEKQRVGVDTGHEDANDFAVVVALDARLGGGQREVLAQAGLDGGRGRGDEVAELIGGSHDKGAESTGRQLHEMDGDDAPGTLDAELLEKGRRHDGLVPREAVGVQEGGADDAADRDAEAPPYRLAAESHNGTARHGAQIGDDLRHRHLRFGEPELVLEHGGVQVLRAVAHEVEASHEENEVAEQKPVALQSNFAFADEDGPGRLPRLAGFPAQALPFPEDLGLGEQQAETDEENGRTSGEPVQGPPRVRCSIDETAGEGGAEKVTKGVLRTSEFLFVNFGSQTREMSK